jgi:hypothetical protein
LIRKWALPVREAHFHREGTFYEHLSQFPGALCDTNGYVLFDSKEEYEKCPKLELKKKANVPEGIVSIPGYQTVEESLRITDVTDV